MVRPPQLLTLGASCWLVAVSASPPTRSPTPACFDLADSLYGAGTCKEWVDDTGFSCASYFGAGGSLAGQCDLTCGGCEGSTTSAPAPAPTSALDCSAAGQFALRVEISDPDPLSSTNQVVVRSQTTSVVFLEATSTQAACVDVGCYEIEVGGGSPSEGLRWSACGETGRSPAGTVVCVDSTGECTKKSADKEVQYESASVATACSSTVGAPVLKASITGVLSTTPYGLALSVKGAVSGLPSDDNRLTAAVATSCDAATFDRLSAGWSVEWESPVLVAHVDATLEQGAVRARDIPGLDASNKTAVFPSEELTLSVFGGPSQLAQVVSLPMTSVTTFRLVDIGYSDSFGDGWNGATLSFTQLEGGNVVYEGTLMNGHGRIDQVLLEAGCYSVDIVDGGLWASEISWGACGGAVGGGAPISTMLCIAPDGTCVGPTQSPTPSAIRGSSDKMSYSLDSDSYEEMRSCEEASLGPSRLTVGIVHMDCADWTVFAAAEAAVSSLYGGTTTESLMLLDSRMQSAARILKDGTLKVTLAMTWGTSDCVVVTNSTLELEVTYNEPILSAVVKNTVESPNITESLSYIQKNRVGYTVGDLWFGDEFGEHSTRTFHATCQEPKKLTAVTFTPQTTSQTLTVNGRNISMADCAGRNRLRIDSTDGLVWATVGLCDVTLATSAAWTCVDAVLPYQSAKVGLGISAKSCELVYDAVSTTAATITLPSTSAVEIWVDGLQIIKQQQNTPAMGSFITDCDLPVQLATQGIGLLIEMSIDGYCGDAVLSDWRCTSEEQVGLNWTLQSAEWTETPKADNVLRRCRSETIPAESLPCVDALGDACSSLLELGASCDRELCPTCSRSHACDASCGWCPGATKPPTPVGSCANFGFELIDTFGDGWNDAEYRIYTSDDSGYPLTGTLVDGENRVDELCLENDECYSLSVTSGLFPSEVRWSFCGMLGNAPVSKQRFCIVDGECEPESSDGVSVRMGVSTEEYPESCSGVVGVPEVTFRAFGMDIATLTASFEDKTTGSKGQVHSMITSTNSFLVEWDDKEAGEDTDCDMDAVATTSWTTELTDTTLRLVVTNSGGGVSAADNDGAGYTLGSRDPGIGRDPVIALRGDTAPNVRTYYFRIATFTNGGKFTLHNNEDRDVFVDGVSGDTVVLAEGCYMLVLNGIGKEAGPSSLCDEVGWHSGIFCVIDGKCSNGTPAPTPSATVVAFDEGLAESHLRFALVKNDLYPSPSCSGAVAPKVRVSVASPHTEEEWCTATIAAVFDDGSKGQVFSSDVNLAHGSMRVVWEDTEEKADCDLDIASVVDWHQTRYAYPSLSVLIDSGIDETDSSEPLKAGYIIEPGDYGPQLFELSPNGFVREQFKFDCTDPLATSTGTASIRAANSFELFVNGVFTRSSSGWATTFDQRELPLRCDGKDVLAVRLRSLGTLKFGFKASFEACSSNEATSGEWKCSGEEEEGWELRGFDDSRWAAATAVEPVRVADLEKFESPAQGAWIWTKGRGLSMDESVVCRRVAAFPSSGNPTPSPTVLATTATDSPTPVPTLAEENHGGSHKTSKRGLQDATTLVIVVLLLILFVATMAFAAVKLRYVLEPTLNRLLFRGQQQWRLLRGSPSSEIVEEESPYHREMELNEMILGGPGDYRPPSAPRSLAARIAQLHRPSQPQVPPNDDDDDDDDGDDAQLGRRYAPAFNDDQDADLEFI